eukprot:SAG11_NODE_33039_length_279_cov_0.977778_1_plen_33_part_10
MRAAMRLMTPCRQAVMRRVGDRFCFCSRVRPTC